MGATAVMVESTTGKTWVLHTPAGAGVGVWLPAQRIDEPEKAARWLDEQAAIKQELARRAAEAGK
jgi:hypothetical protein